jgi:hypothetical protein
MEQPVSGFGFYFRRLVLALAAMMIAGGWGLTHYADAQLQTAASGSTEVVTAWTGERTKTRSWVEEDGFLPGRTMYWAGMIAMGVGAGILVTAFPRGAWVSHG